MSDPSDSAGLLINTLTDAHLEYKPEIAPSTSADTKPITIPINDHDPLEIDDTHSIDTEEYPDVIPSSPLLTPQRPAMMNGQPLPDLRHEQTYLAALYKTDLSYYSIARVTLLDFLLWPTIMNFVYVLGINGFRSLRVGSTSSGRRFGEVLRDALNIGGILD